MLLKQVKVLFTPTTLRMQKFRMLWVSIFTQAKNIPTIFAGMFFHFDLCILFIFDLLYLFQLYCVKGILLTFNFLRVYNIISIFKGEVYMMSADFFWSLKKSIDEELSLLSRSLSELTDKDLTNETYINLSRTCDHIQNLFDQISIASKDLDLVQSNPEFYELLEANQQLNENYGKFHRMRNNFLNLFAKLRENKEEDFVLDRSDLVDPDEDPQEETEETPVDELKEEPSEIIEIIEENPDEKKKSKYADRKDRQARRDEEYLRQDILRAEEQRRTDELRIEEDRRRLEQIERQNELVKLDTMNRQDQVFSEADILREHNHLDEVRIQEQDLLRTEQRRADELHIEEDRHRIEQMESRDEAIRLGMPVRPDQVFTEADILRERIRQDEERLQEQNLAEQRIRNENDAMRRTREKLERSERFEGLGNSHIDMSWDADRSGRSEHPHSNSSYFYADDIHHPHSSADPYLYHSNQNTDILSPTFDPQKQTSPFTGN